MNEELESTKLTVEPPPAAQRIPATGGNLCTVCKGVGLIGTETCAVCGGTGHLPLPSAGI